MLSITINKLRSGITLRLYVHNQRSQKLSLATSVLVQNADVPLSGYRTIEELKIASFPDYHMRLTL